MAKGPVKAAEEKPTGKTPEQIKAENRERWQNNAPIRMTNALEKIELVGKLANYASYDFTAAEAAKIGGDLEAAVEAVKAAFAKQLANPAQRVARERKLYKL